MEKYNDEIVIVNEEVDSAALPSLDDLMRELDAYDPADDEHNNSTSTADTGKSAEYVFELQNESPASASSLPADVVVYERMQAVDETREAEAVALVSAKREVLRLEGEKQSLLAALARQQNDFEAYRRRTERDRTDARQNTVNSIVKELLPVLDNFGRALAAANSESEQSTAQVVAGVELIYQQLQAILIDLGVQPVPALGEAFDPRWHEAVAMEPNTDAAPNIVIEEFQRGYRMGEQLIRPAMVKVAA